MLRSRTARAASSIIRNVSRPSLRTLASVAPVQGKDPVELDNITTLPNGLRVATEALPGHFSGVGVYIDAGSRYENAYLSGVSHIIDRLAFKSTSTRTADKMLESMEMLGGNIQCASSREALMYQAATFNSGIPDTMAILAETIRDPLVTPTEIEQQLQTAEYEIEEIWAKPELILPELVHVAAYRNNTLGNPLLCPKDRLPAINRDVIDAYRRTFYHPERMVIAFAGVNHEEAVRMTEKYFGDMPKGTGPALPSEADIKSSLEPISAATGSTSYVGTPPPHQKSILSKLPFIKNLSTSASRAASVSDQSLSFEPPNLTLPATYTGGFMSLPAAPILNPNIPPLTHMHLCFEAPSITSDEIYTVAVMQTLLGGGGSFSAGGPGKGMYSRLYTNVLNQHGWIESCVAFNHGYSDSGIFGIAASCIDPSHTPHMLDVMCRELKMLFAEAGRGVLTSREVERAKNQLRSNLLMNLESRMVELEDLGRQVQTHGRKIGAQEMCDKIQGVTVADIQRVAKMMFQGGVQSPGGGSGAPTVIVQQQGHEQDTGFKGGWQEIQERIKKWGLGRM
ncbi:hypothetical protein BT63DRAFT_457953 [Microthyrium microscopicum]|uniref:Mitochondrial-processing peptidase subunit alpha n=1 Tax=Microthyrium microscopicum TaxID=703497 RepID=A0A6A6U5T5_9PEZI|nr:hypothetical protein BT63DRAFT_457953 [Microthyrium microscopicum]